MRKSIITLLAAAALLAVAATPAFAIESAGSPVYITGQKGQLPRGLASEGGSVKSDLCEYEACGSESAIAWAAEWALYYWGGPVDGEYCTGPYGNGKTHDETQWACYGFDWNGDFYWQVNVDPWGEATYHKKL